jgi:hypothetical protein
MFTLYGTRGNIGDTKPQDPVLYNRLAAFIGVLYEGFPSAIVLVAVTLELRTSHELTETEMEAIFMMLLVGSSIDIFSAALPFGSGMMNGPISCAFTEGVW